MATKNNDNEETTFITSIKDTPPKNCDYKGDSTANVTFAFPQSDQIVTKGNDKERKGDTSSSAIPTEERNKINILIIGTIGAGKATLANGIVGKEVFSLHKNCITSATRDPCIRGQNAENNGENLRYGFVLIDTFGAFQSYDTSAERLKEYFDVYLSDGVNLIIIVIRKGSTSAEEIETLKYIVKKKLKNAKSHTALVFTACEGLSESKREEFKQKFQQSNASAKAIMDFVSQGKNVHFVSFPPLEDVDESQIEAYSTKAEKSKEALRKLISECSNKLLFSDIFSDCGKKSNWSLVPSHKEGDLLCSIA